jgi:hypothetical protein
VAADDGGNRGRQRWRMTMAVDDDGSQDWAADYDGEGQERAARDGGDSGVVMMAATKMAAVDNNGNGGGRQRHARLGGGLQRGRSRAGDKQ